MRPACFPKLDGRTCTVLFVAPILAMLVVRIFDSTLIIHELTNVFSNQTGQYQITKFILFHMIDNANNVKDQTIQCAIDLSSMDTG